MADKPKTQDNPLLTKLTAMGDGYSVQKTELAAQILLDCNNHTFGLPRDEQAQYVERTLTALIRAGFHAYRDDNKTAFTEFVAPGVTGVANHMGYTQACFAIGQMEHDGHLDPTKRRELEGLAKPASPAHAGHHFEAR